MASGCRTQQGHEDYIRGCTACAALHRNADQQRKDPGYEPPVPSGPIRDHITRLNAAGMHDAAIVREAGVSTGALWRVRRNTRCYASTAKKILAVPVPSGIRPDDAVDLDIVRAHVKNLTAAGMMIRDIAAEVPMNRRVLGRYMTGTGRRADWVDSTTARKILAVTPRLSLRADLIDVTGTRRRLRALAVDGHGMRKVAAAFGCRNNTIIDIANDDNRKLVRRSLAEKITRLYDEWIGLPGTKQAAQAARARNWLGPDRWTGLDMDDPTTEPHPTPDPEPKPEPDIDPDDLEYGPIRERSPDEINYVNVQHAIVGVMFRDELTTAELAEVVRRLARRGMSDADIHVHLRWSADYATMTTRQRATTVGNWRRNHGIPIGPDTACDTYLEERRQRERYCAPAGTPVRRRYDSIPPSEAVFAARRQSRQRETAAA